MAQDSYSQNGRRRREVAVPRQQSEWVSHSFEDLIPEWQREAHCAGTGLENYFGADTGSQPTMSIKQVRNAAKLCDVCPVFLECLRHTLEFREEYGVWAGTSGRARRPLFKMLDMGLTVEEVMKEHLDERARRVGRSRPSSLEPHRGRSGEDEGAGGVRAADAGSVAL